MSARSRPTAAGGFLRRLFRNDIARGAVAGAIVGALAWPFIPGVPVPVSTSAVPTAQAQAPAAMPELRHATFGDRDVSNDARSVADWVAASNDAAGRPFIVIDKRNARLLVFDEDATLVADTAILLGGAVGDDTVPGIGERDLEAVKPNERTTPAGRFMGERGRNARGEDVVWVDYDAGVSMHRVLTTHPEERRLERLATPTAEDNRISYGCINVPAAFFELEVAPLFAFRNTPVYILPEQRTLAEVFGWPAAQHDAASHEWLPASVAVGDVMP